MSVSKKKIKKAKQQAEFLRLYLATLLQYENQPIELRKRQQAMHELSEELVRFIDEVQS
jgi:hypothetical protein